MTGYGWEVLDVKGKIDKFVTSVKIKATSDSKLNRSPDTADSV